jgi:tRNA (adenine37-N6)-methyltransferase
MYIVIFRLQALSLIMVNLKNGIIFTPFIDAEPGSPILDIKPYFPMERVKKCDVPEWFKHWPEWSEEAISFNWQNEINFG